ncbi:SatD family protein [Terrabacter sp. C0L_2]|uniref:SatD family protein n=1 Tax=Terrabacter sp. C0L_2 TaxID=3108389 RepID=UPI002ED4D943|nr:SatD family protein [Terrabacter sp. C0L_2]
MALIGDIVESRTHRQRQALHDAFAAAIARANAEVPVDDPAVITVGDEFQCVYPTLGAALRASFVVRAELHPTADVRFGLGRGEVTTLDPVRGIHDGPAYWAAREAITTAEDRARRAQTRTSRTAYVAPDEPEATVAAVRAALDCLDFMVGSMSTTSRGVLGGLMRGLAQQDIADELGISASAVSQRVRRDGIGVALEAMSTLGGLP